MFENSNKPQASTTVSLMGQKQRGSQNITVPPILPLLPHPPPPPPLGHSWAWHSEGRRGEWVRGWRWAAEEDGVMQLILLFPLSGGSKQPLFGCLFILPQTVREERRSTHIHRHLQSVTPCLFLDHILFYCSRQLCQRLSYRYGDIYTSWPEPCNEILKHLCVAEIHLYLVFSLNSSNVTFSSKLPQQWSIYNVAFCLQWRSNV